MQNEKHYSKQPGGNLKTNMH